jgi:hypothetical protein
VRRPNHVLPRIFVLGPDRQGRTNYPQISPVATDIGVYYRALNVNAGTVIMDTQWWPARLVTLNRLSRLAGAQQRVVSLPGQYRQHVYQQMKVSLYASTSADCSALG